MTWLRRIEKTLDQRLRAAFGGGRENAREAIELYREVLEEVSRRTTPGIRGTPIFPFNRIRIALKAEHAERKATLDAIFAPGQLANDVLTCLKESCATAPADLAVEIRFNAEQGDEINLAFERVDEPVIATEPVDTPPAITFPARIPIRLITVAGISSCPEFELEGTSVYIGRGFDVIDAAGRTVRRNNLFFTEEDTPAVGVAINASVSRAHAHLLLDPSSGGWRIYDDGSSFGSSVFRHGRRIDVPAHAVRGVGLQPGDEIWLGNACVRFETGL
jgi:hypothetical protein